MLRSSSRESCIQVTLKTSSLLLLLQQTISVEQHLHTERGASREPCMIFQLRGKRAGENGRRQHDCKGNGIAYGICLKGQPGFGKENPNNTTLRSEPAILQRYPLVKTEIISTPRMYTVTILVSGKSRWSNRNPIAVHTASARTVTAISRSDGISAPKNRRRLCGFV